MNNNGEGGGAAGSHRIDQVSTYYGVASGSLGQKFPVWYLIVFTDRVCTLLFNYRFLKMLLLELKLTLMEGVGGD